MQYKWNSRCTNGFRRIEIMNLYKTYLSFNLEMLILYITFHGYWVSARDNYSEKYMFYAESIVGILYHFICIVIQLLCGVPFLFSSHYDFFFAHIYTLRPYILIRRTCWNAALKSKTRMFMLCYKTLENFIKIYKHIDGNFYCRKHKYLWLHISKCHPGFVWLDDLNIFLTHPNRK